MAKGMSGTATISVQSKNPDILTNLEDIPDLNAIKSKVGVLESSAIYNKGGYYEEFSLIAADLSQLNKINKPRLENGDSITDFSGDKIILPNRFTSKYKIKKVILLLYRFMESLILFKLVILHLMIQYF